MDGDYEAAPLTGNHNVIKPFHKKVTDCEVASPIGVGWCSIRPFPQMSGLDCLGCYI